MNIGHLNIDYLSHVCFRFQSLRGVVLLTDPFFADGFQWNGHFEKYLSPPAIKPQDIDICNIIFVSHEHGDHFDPDAIITIQQKSRAKVIAPVEVLEILKQKGAATELLLPAEEGARFDFKDLCLHTYCGYDNSTDPAGRANKFSLTVECRNTNIFFSGDCHTLPPAVIDKNFDAILCWPVPEDEKLLRLCTGLNTKKFVIMHGDRFTPGDFICNLDYAEQKKRIEKLIPKMEAIIPTRIKTTAELSAYKSEVDHE